jgi:putative hydrolase of the HAD superfamily
VTTAVCFDLDGTLVEFTRPYAEVLAETFEACLGRSSSRLIEVYNERFFEVLLAVEPEPYLAGMRAVRDAADADAGVDPAPEALVAELRDREVEATAVTDGARALPDSLSDHPLGVVTNCLPEWQRAKLRHHDLLGRFEAVVTAYEVGAHKPDPAPFEAVRERIEADRYVMIGDDYDADVEGARAAGFEAVSIDPETPAPAQVRDLDALAALLDSLG